MMSFSFIEAIFKASQVAFVVKNLPANAGDARDEGWIPGSVFLPGGSHEQRSLAGCGSYSCRVWHDWSNLAHTQSQDLHIRNRFTPSFFWCTMSVTFSSWFSVEKLRFFGVITLNSFSDRLPISSSFIWSYRFLPCSFFCNISFSHFTVCLWLIHVIIWQEPTHYKAIIPQFKKIAPPKKKM